MATDRVRVTLSFPEEEIAIYRRIAKHQGVKVQRILHEMLEVAYPAAEASLKLLDQLEGVTDEQRQLVSAAADEADANLGSILAVMLGQMGLFTDEVNGIVQSPRPSNTGATFSPQVQNPPSSSSSSPPSSSSNPALSLLTNDPSKGVA